VTLYRLAISKLVSQCLDAVVACAAGKQVHAEQLVAACDAMLALPPPPIRPIYLAMVADELVTRGHLVEARIPIKAARAKLQASQGERWPIPELLRVEAALASRSGDERTAEELRLQSLALADEAGATGWSPRTALSLAQLRRDAGREREAAAALAPVITRVVDGAARKILTMRRNCCCTYPVAELTMFALAYPAPGAFHNRSLCVRPLRANTGRPHNDANDPQRTQAGVSLIHLCVGANPYIGSRGVFDNRQALAGRPGRDLSS
jgi:hypothetical protein